MSQLAGRAIPEQVAGYDARVDLDGFAERWPEERRNGFLYRLDVRNVLSAETTVWPSILEDLGDEQYCLPAALNGLWVDQEALRNALSLRAERGPLPPFRTVLVTLVWNEGESDHPLSVVMEDCVKAPDPDSHWHFMGYDVGDTYLLSALTNCGLRLRYNDDEVRALRRTWVPHLNEFHLFTDLAAADDFQSFSDVRLEHDHAPTFIYGIYVLKPSQ